MNKQQRDEKAALEAAETRAKKGGSLGATLKDSKTKQKKKGKSKP